MVVPQRSYILLVIFLLRGLKAELHGTIGYQIPCKSAESDCKESLEEIAADITEGANVCIDIKSDRLYLSENVTFSKLNSLLISGNPNSSTIIDCSLSTSNAGFTLERITNLTLKNLTLTSCGARFSVRKNKTYISALRLINSNDVNMEYLAITESMGIGLTVQRYEGGRFFVAWSNFTNNRLPSELQEKNFSGGGGVFIGEFLHSSNLSVSFEFDHCRFEKNVAHTRYFKSFYSDQFGQERTGYGQGGGMFLAIENDIIYSSMKIHLTNCIYTENEAFFGGGLSIKIGRANVLSAITKIEILVENSEFEFNGCANRSNTRIGGGAHLSYISLKIKTNDGIKYTLRNVKFTKNCAELGGGMFILSSRYNTNDNLITFDNCKFERNKAHTGSAIDLIPSGFVTTTGYTLFPVFRNCTFLDNFATINFDPTSKQMTAGIGTLYATLYNIGFEDVNYFINNTGTALYMVNSVANFSQSNALFYNNQGERGGAIALIGASVLLIGPEREYTFANNSALYKGGALYASLINSHYFTISRSCFIQFFNGNRTTSTKNWNTKIVFTGNTAQVGRTIFTTSISPCQSINNQTDDNPFFITVHGLEVFTLRGINISNDSVATAGARLHHKHDNVLHIIPGRWYEHNVTIMDDMNNTVNEPLRKIITNTHNCTEILNLETEYVGNKVRLLESDRPEKEVNLCLHTVSTRDSYTTIKVEIKECPPGFKLENQECTCNFADYYGLIGCNDYHSLLTLGLWAGTIDDEMVTSICPRRFCSYNSSQTKNQSILSAVILPRSKQDLNEAVCGKTRNGVLCGECAQNYTAYFHSPNFLCKSADPTLCKVGWLFYILSELVPVTVVFITVLVLNISFTSGAVNGFILFSQILLSLNIDASGIITFPGQSLVTEGYQFLYGFLNLDFFTTDTMSFCLWPNATALDMLAFKYITIIYALSLVILVIWFMNKCGGRCLGRWWRITTVKSSIIHGISAFLIICYSQSIMVSSSLLNGVELWLKVNSTLPLPLPWRVWQNGNLLYFRGFHLLYALPAVFCWLTIGILPPILLLSYPLLNKVLAILGCEESKLVHVVSRKLPISSLKPLLDSFQGCFKDNLRFFAGLYFIYRWTAPLVNATTSSLGTAYIISEVLLIMMLALHALFQPYQQRMHNVIDTLLFTDLILINSITFYHYHLFQSQESRHTIKGNVSIAAGIQMTLIYLPLLIVILYMLVAGCKRICGLYSKNHASHNREEIDKPGTQSLQRLRAAVRSISSLSGGISADNEELPHRFIVGEVSYECFEDTDYARDMPTDNKSMQDVATY